MLQALEAGRSFDVVCGCRHAFCFACAAEAHEPATCQQVSIVQLSSNRQTGTMTTIMTNDGNLPIVMIVAMCDNIWVY